MARHSIKLPRNTQLFIVRINHLWLGPASLAASVSSYLHMTRRRSHWTFHLCRRYQMVISWPLPGSGAGAGLPCRAVRQTRNWVSLWQNTTRHHTAEVHGETRKKKETGIFFSGNIRVGAASKSLHMWFESVWMCEFSPQNICLPQYKSRLSVVSRCHSGLWSSPPPSPSPAQQHRDTASMNFNHLGTSAFYRVPQTFTSIL